MPSNPAINDETQPFIENIPTRGGPRFFQGRPYLVVPDAIANNPIFMHTQLYRPDRLVKVAERLMGLRPG